MTAFVEQGLLESNDAWKLAIAKVGYGGPQVAFWLDAPGANRVLLTSGYSETWINVYARELRPGSNDGEILQYGWSISEHRWARQHRPPKARELRNVLIRVNGLTPGR
jgi:hypothetical protein